MTYRISAIVVFVLAFLLPLSAPASAEQAHIVVRAGRSTQIGFIATRPESGCSAVSKPKVTLKKAPAHGTVKIIWRAERQTKGLCKGSLIKGMAVIFTPRGGFRGSDAFVLDTYTSYYVGDPPNYFIRYQVSVTVE